jgi:hypothetical protein
MQVKACVVAFVGVLAVLAGLEGEAGTAAEPVHTTKGCATARVRYTPYPGGDRRLDALPWVRGEPARTGLVGLLWYWPFEWRQRGVRAARIYTGGSAAAGYSTKILWVFTARSARGRGATRLAVRGRRLDAPGSFRQEFAAVSYAGQRGAPSYASIVDVPSAGCWRLELSTGSLRASLNFQAVRAAERPTTCTTSEVETLVGRFVEAFNAGDTAALDRLFAREPEFEWYTTDGPGERDIPLAYDRGSLVSYFRDRHDRGEALDLHSVTFNGNTTGARTYGNFVYSLTRRADDLEPTDYRGKGAALCYPTRADQIFVWSMGQSG